MSGATPEQRRSTGRASAVLAAGTLTSRVLGYVRSILLAFTIGTATNAADAFGIANQLPNTMYQLTAGGVLTAVLVPQIVQATKASDGGRDYINRISTLAILLFSGAAAALTIVSPLLIRLYTSDWPPAEVALATAMAYWCMPQVFFYGLYALLAGILNARNVFGPFTWAPVLNNVVSIAGLTVFLALFGADGRGLVPVEAWTAGRVALLAGTSTLGVAAQALILFAFWRGAGLAFRPDFTFRGVGLGDTFRAASWILATVLVDAVVGLFQSNVATSALSARGDGSAELIGNGAMTNAWLMFVLPHSIVAVSIVTVYFTRLSESWQSDDVAGFRRGFSRAARVIGSVTTFATAVMIVLSAPLMRLYNSAGSYELTRGLAWVLALFVLGLVPYSFLFLLQRTFYAADDTRTPFLLAVLSGAVMLTGFVPVSHLDPHRVVAGIAVVVTTSNWTASIVGFWLLRRRVGRLDGFAIVRSHVRMATATAGSAIIGGGVAAALGCFREGGYAVSSVGGVLVSCLVVACSMAAVYLLLARVFHVTELTEVLDVIRARLRRS